MKIVALTSGGKDSLYALYLMMQQGFEIKYLVSIIPKNPDSYMFHQPNNQLIKMQAESMNLPVIIKETKGEKEKELDDLKDVIYSIKDKVEAIVSGAIQSEYQKERVDLICEGLNLKSFAPLWHKNPELLWKDLLHAGFKVIITSVSAQGLNEEWLGKEITEENLEKLRELSRKYRFHLSFEGGEAETAVLDCPMFKKRIKILKSKREWNGSFGHYLIKKLEFIKK